MRIKALFLVLLMVMAAGVSECAIKKRPGGNDLIRKGIAAVRYGLKDPKAARFRNVRVGEDSSVKGEVNAKNSYGGYTGFEKFYFQKGTVVLEGSFIKNYEDWVDAVRNADKALAEGGIVSNFDAIGKANREFAIEHKLMFEDGW